MTDPARPKLPTPLATIPDPNETSYQAFVQSIQDGYSELEKYSINFGDLSGLITSDLVSRLGRAREWGNRVLHMWREARKNFTHVNAHASGLQDYFERLVGMYLRDTQFPKGLNADERKAMAELQYLGYHYLAQRWADLLDEYRAYVKECEKKHQDLMDAKNDVRTALWAMRLQFALGERSMDLSTNGQAAAAAARTRQPVFETDASDDLTKVPAGHHTSDELLNSKSAAKIQD
jgi:hypothetical protein